MKQYRLPSLLLASAALAWAVPSEINYQGRLTDANGDPLTGEVSMSLKMFDAATDGNELYSEDLGTVTLDDNGVYSFQFGASGQSVVATSESITSTDGVNQVFNATLANLPVDGSVSVSDGTYTWSQANGSSSSTEFTASLTPSSGTISIIYLNGVPTSNVDITASYNYMDATLSGALSSHDSHWLELSVDGTAQAPRERVLSVPFAQYARGIFPVAGDKEKIVGHLFSTVGDFTLLPKSYRRKYSNDPDLLLIHPLNHRVGTKIKTINANLNLNRINNLHPYGEATLEFVRTSIQNLDTESLLSITTDQVEPKKYVINADHVMEEGFFYFIRINLGGVTDGVSQINSLDYTYRE